MVLDLKVILPKKIEKKHVRIFKKLHEDCLVLQILTINVKHALNLVFLSNVSETKTAGASSF